jgi:hypothetical protein
VAVRWHTFLRRRKPLIGAAAFGVASVLATYFTSPRMLSVARTNPRRLFAEISTPLIPPLGDAAPSGLPIP